MIFSFVLMRYKEKVGHWPLLKAKKPPGTPSNDTKSEEAGVGYSPKAPEAVEEKQINVSVSHASS